MPTPKNTAHDILFALVSRLDGSALTGAVVQAYRCLDGGSQEPSAGSVVEQGNGQYSFEGIAADFDADYTVGLLFVAADAVPAHVLLQMTYFRKNTAYAVPLLLLDVSTGAGLAGASPVGRRCLDGGPQEAVSGTFVERGNGQYVFMAAADDFGADDFVGFLITATGAVPTHLVIDLLESYADSGVLTDTPAAVLAHYLTGLAMMSVPGSGEWPLYVSSLPDGPDVADDAAGIFNTTPLKDADLMGGGVVQHYGVTLMLRATDGEVGYNKCETLVAALDAMHGTDVTKEDATYRVHGTVNPGGVNAIGQEQGTKRRELFTVNLLVAMSKL